VVVRSVADACQHRPEGDAGQLQRGAFEVDHVAVRHSLQRQRDHVGSEQRLEGRVVVVALGRDLDVDFLALAGVAPDKMQSRNCRRAVSR
jgi:predicted Zn-dependent protease